MDVLSAVKAMKIEGLSRIADPIILNILNEVEDSINLTKLQEIIVDIYGEVDLLLTPAKRKIIFEYLSKDVAEELCDYLNVPYTQSENIWNKINRLNFNSNRKKKLLEFFNIKNADEYCAPEKIEISPDIVTVSPQYGLFKHQENAAIQIKEKIQNNRSKVLLHMPTGSGKTRTAMSICCDFIRNHLENRDQKVVFWFADTEELCQQATEEFKKAWACLGVGDVDLYRLYGDSSIALKDIESGFVVAGLQKINSLITSNQSDFYTLGSKTSLTVFDEAHKVLAPTYQHIINVFQATGTSSLIGLSATPGRSTFDAEENDKFAEFFDYNKVALRVSGYENPVQYLQSEGYLAETNYHPLPYNSDEIKLTDNELRILSEGGDIPKNILKRLGLDAKRNILILNTVLDACKKGSKIILFACSVNNAETLYTLLKYKGIKAGLVTSSTDNNVRKNIIESYKESDMQVLVNFGVLTTGFDAPKTNTAVIARPTNSLTLFSQMVGRATRGINAGGNKIADIYVINDTLPGFRDMATAFNHWDNAWEEK